MQGQAKSVRRACARKTRWLFHLERAPWVATLFVAAAISSAAQQSVSPSQPAAPADDLQKQLAQLKQQYEATTHDLEQRIASLEQQIQKQQEKEKEEKEAHEKAKQGTISAAELAAQQAAEKAVLGQSNQVGARYQGDVASEPTYETKGRTLEQIEQSFHGKVATRGRGLVQNA
jgi:Skp family chaperone for outer membrane proteins